MASESGADGAGGDRHPAAGDRVRSAGGPVQTAPETGSPEHRTGVQGAAALQQRRRHRHRGAPRRD